VGKKNQRDSPLYIQASKRKKKKRPEGDKDQGVLEKMPGANDQGVSGLTTTSVKEKKGRKRKSASHESHFVYTFQFWKSEEARGNRPKG